MTLEELARRNTELEGAILLAQKDIQTLRDFINELMPNYGRAKMLEEWQVKELISASQRILIPVINEGSLNQICGALKAINMVEQAEHLESIGQHIRRASQHNQEISGIIYAAFNAEGSDFTARCDKVIKDTGGAWTRDYLAAYRKQNEDTNASN